MDIYAANIMDHYRYPRNRGSLPRPDAAAREANASCGDEISVSLTMAGNRITALRFTGQGCVISQAAISLLSETLPGMTKTAALRLDLADIEKILGIPLSPRRHNCALLGLQTIQKALKNL